MSSDCTWYQWRLAESFLVDCGVRGKSKITMDKTIKSLMTFSSFPCLFPTSRSEFLFQTPTFMIYDINWPFKWSILKWLEASSWVWWQYFPQQTLEFMLDKFEDTYGNTREIIESGIILEKLGSHGIRTKQKVKQAGWGVSTQLVSGSGPG